MAFNKVIVSFAMLAIFAAAVQADEQPRDRVVEAGQAPVDQPQNGAVIPPPIDHSRSKKFALYSTYSSYALPTYYTGYPITSYSSSYAIHKPLPYAYSAYYPAPYYAAPYIL